MSLSKRCQIMSEDSTVTFSAKSSLWRVWLTLIVRGERFDPDEFLHRFRFRPTKVVRNGEQRVVKDGRLTTPSRQGRLEFERRVRNVRDVSKVVERFLTPYAADAAAIAAFAKSKECKIEFWITLLDGSDTRTWHLTAESVSLLATMGADIGGSFYAE